MIRYDQKRFRVGTRSHVPETAPETAQKPQNLPAIIVGIACLLQLIAPARLSGDSAFYILPAMTGDTLFHPHHLLYAAFLRVFYLGGSALGLSDVPYLSMRACMLVFSTVALIACFNFLRRLHVRPIIAALITFIVSVSGLFWQYSVQIEAYIPTFAWLALSGWAALTAAQSHRSLCRWTAILLASFFLAIATTFHQAAAITAPFFGMIYYIARAQSSGQRREALLGAVVIPGGAGLISILAYIAGWLVARSGVSFAFWMTKYAHWTGMPWGLRENLSITGVKTLFRSWGASWLNFTPDVLHDGVPGKYALAILFVFAVFAVAFSILIYATWLSRSRRRIPPHIIWIVLWLAALELFILWWTPFLKNFQAIALLPEAALLGLAAEWVAQGRRSETPSTTSLSRSSDFPSIAVIFVLTLGALAVFGINFRYLIVPGLNDRLAPEGALLIIEPHLSDGDLFIAEFPESVNMQTLMAFQNSMSIVELAKSINSIPDWTQEANRSKHVIIYKNSVGYSQIALDRAKTTLEQIWDPILQRLEASAGGRDKLRADTISNGDKLQAVVFGVSPQLPLTAAQAYLRMAQAAPGIKHSATNAPQYFWDKIPIDQRSPELNAARRKALEDGSLAPALNVPFVDAGGKPLWFAGLDTSKLEVTSATLVGHSSGRDPIAWTTLQKPLRLNLYTKMEVAAQITPPDSTKAETSIRVFFKLANSQVVVKAASISMPFPADGKRHKVSVDLQDYPFVMSADRVVGLRIDPGDLDGSEFRIYEVGFLVEEP